MVEVKRMHLMHSCIHAFSAIHATLFFPNFKVWLCRVVDACHFSGCRPTVSPVRAASDGFCIYRFLFFHVARFTAPLQGEGGSRPPFNASSISVSVKTRLAIFN
jgi:hypothetical protein